jgi:Peptidase family M23
MNMRPSRGLAPVLLGVLAFIISSAVTVWAVDYTIVFSQNTDGSWNVTLGSPHGGATYANVVSKYSQPRVVSSGTNPHRGTDLRSTYGTYVYAPWNGWVTLASGTDFEMRLDINQDGVQNDNAYMRYDHLSAIYVTNGSFVTKGSLVAASGDENGSFAAHLHFGVMRDSNADGRGDLWVRNEPYYTTVSTWDYGRRLDFISGGSWDATTHVAAYYCYAADEVSQSESVAQGDVTFFHRVTTGGAWSSTVGTKNGNQFSIDLTGRYPVGSQVQWMVRCSRTSKKATANPYWAFEPPKFSQPDFDPNATAQAYSYFTSPMN